MTASDLDEDNGNWTCARPAAALALEHLVRINDVKRSEGMFRDLANSMPQIIWTGTADGRMDYWNNQAMTYSGSTFEQLAGWKWSALLHREDRLRTVRVWREALKGERTFEINYRIRRGADGAYRWHLGRGYPVRDHQGRLTRWIGTCTDIHDQIEAQQQLDEAQNLAQIGSWHFDTSARQFRSSAQLRRMRGGNGAISVRRFLRAMKPADRQIFFDDVRASHDDRSSLEFWHRMSDRNNAARFFHHHVKMIAPEGRLTRAFGTMQDVTEHYTSAAATGLERILLTTDGDAILLRGTNVLIRLQSMR